LRVARATKADGRSFKLHFENEREEETNRVLRFGAWDKDQVGLSGVGLPAIGFPMYVILTFEPFRESCLHRRPEKNDRVIRCEVKSIFLPDWHLLKGDVAIVCQVDREHKCFKLKNPKGDESPFLKYKFFDYMESGDASARRIKQDAAESSFSKLRRATLYFSFFGLRDLMVDDSEATFGMAPVVDVKVKKFQDPSAGQHGKAHDKHAAAYFQDTFEYKTKGEDSDEAPAKWQTRAFDTVWKKPCWNYEFFDVCKIEVELPDKNVLEPYLTAHVKTKYDQGGFLNRLNEQISTPADFDLRVSLSSMYPCIWFDPISLEKPFENQRGKILRQVEKSENKGQAKYKVEQIEDAGDDDVLALEEGDGDDEDELTPIQADVKMMEEVTTAALPRELAPFVSEKQCKEGDVANEFGYDANHQPLALLNVNDDALNMKEWESFKHDNTEMKGATDSETAAVRAVPEKMEDSPDFDFPFRNRPLFMKGTTDIIPSLFAKDWVFAHKECKGFVKFHAKLVHGWDDCHGREEDLSEEAVFEDAGKILKEVLEARRQEHDALPDDERKRREESRYMLLQTFDTIPKGITPGMPNEKMQKYRKDLDKFAFRSEKLEKRDPRGEYFSKTFLDTHKDEVLSKPIRLRIYFYQGICIKGGPKKVDPYLSFQVGDGSVNDMKEEVRLGNNMPSWGGMSRELDIELPAAGRLEVTMLDLPDAIDKVTNSIMGETNIIGSTVIDLEDRWHWNVWKNYSRYKKAPDPKETRPLKVPGKTFENNGSLEIRIEMFKTEMASEYRPAPPLAQAASTVEIRVVIWSCTGVKLVDGGHIDAKIGTKLVCDEYNEKVIEHQLCSEIQYTDVHRNCVDGAPEFNWRVIYPDIDMSKEKNKNCRLKFQLYDDNLVSSDIYVGEVEIDIVQFAAKVARTQETIKIEKNKLACTKKDEVTNENVNVGVIIIDLEIMAQAEADGKRNAPGRGEPNEHPSLTTPEAGRGMGDLLAGFDFTGAFGGLGLLKKVLPIIIFLLASLILLKWIGLL